MPTVTLKQVAAQSGYSVATVGHVLGKHSDRYQAKTKQAILNTAHELGYRPNHAAQAMRNGRHNCVSLLIGNAPLVHYLPTEILAGIQHVFKQTDKHLAIELTDASQISSDGFVPQILKKTVSDGLLMYYSSRILPNMIQTVNQLHEPVIWANTKAAFDCVYFDDIQASKQATQRLLALGHKRILYADIGNTTTDDAHYSVPDRITGYELAMQQAGLTPQPAIHGKYTTREKRIVEMLRSPDRPTAIITYGPSLAANIAYLALQANIKIPQDLSLITFNFMASDIIAGIPINTVLLPEFDLGQAAAQAILKKIENPKEKLPSVCLPPSYIEGNTCSPPSK